MGHDISAYTAPHSEICSLRRTAFNPLNHVIYEVLDCKDQHYGGVSGYGESQEFTCDQIKEAIP